MHPCMATRFAGADFQSKEDFMPTTISEKARKVKSSSTLAITARAKELRVQGYDIVSFGAGEPDFPTPKNICEAGKKAIDDGFTRYTPAAGTAELRKAVSTKFKYVNRLHYEPKQVVISNGGKQSLMNAFEAIINPGDEVILPAPYWLSYPELIRLAGGVPVIVNCGKDVGYKLTAEALSAAVTPNTKALVLNDPNNPTGAVYTKNELSAIAQVVVEKDFYVIADEMYESLVYGDAKHVSIASLGAEIYQRTITVCGLSKSYAMTGWRIGYTGSNAEIAKLMGSIQSHQTSNPCSISQAAALEALTGPQNDVEAMLVEFGKRNRFICDCLSRIPHLSAIEPQGAFYLFVDCSELIGKAYKGKTITSAADIAEILINDFLVAVIPCADFGYPDHIRLSYAISQSDIAKGMERIGDFVKAVE